MHGSDFVAPAHVQAVYADVMRHRVGMSYEAESLRMTADQVLAQILKDTSVPVSASAAA
jgi:MoxR-like ATPase